MQYNTIQVAVFSCPARFLTFPYQKNVARMVDICEGSA